jgi:hypothetical protein
MVNFYDNYQQSQVMNYIPEAAKGLLKAQKEQVAVESEYASLIDKMIEKSNGEFISADDRKEYISRAEPRINKARAIASDQSLSPLDKFRGISGVNQEMLSDRRMHTLLESNKNMAKEVDKIKPSLQGYFNRSILPYLKTPSDGTVWRDNMSYDPEQDFKDIGEKMQSHISKSVLTDKDGKPIKNGDQYVYGITQDRINDWVEKNYETFMSTMPGAVFATADVIEREVIAGGSGSSLSRVDFSDPVHSNIVEDKFKETLRNLFSEYAGQKMSGQRKSNFNININQEKPTTPVPLMDVFYQELDAAGLFDRAGASFGVSGDPNNKLKYNLSELANKVKSKSGGRLPSSRVTVSDQGISDSIWKSGSQIGVIASSGADQNTVEIGDAGSFRTTTSSNEKNYNIFPALPATTHAISYAIAGDKDLSKGWKSVNKGVVSGYNQNRFGEAIKDLSEFKLVTLMETTSITSEHALLPMGEVGSIAKIKIPLKGNDKVPNPLSYLFGKDVSAIVGPQLAKAKPGQPIPISVGGGFTIMIERAHYDKDKSPDGKAGEYFTFEVAKPAGRMSGKSLTAAKVNLGGEGKGTNTSMGTGTNQVYPTK